MDDFGYNKDMADNTTEAPVQNKAEELIPPMQPGIHHPKHPDAARQAIANELGTKEENIIPPEERAESIMEGARTSFLEDVTHIQPAQTPEPDNSPSNNLGEILNAYSLGEGQDNVRVVPNSEVAQLEAERRAKMAGQEGEKAA